MQFEYAKQHVSIICQEKKIPIYLNEKFEKLSMGKNVI